MSRSLQAPFLLKIVPLMLGVLLVVFLNTVGAAEDTCGYHPEAYAGLDPAALEHELNSTGLIGRMHGAAANEHLYVLSVREPTNFFSHVEYSLLSQGNTESFQTLARHDLVCVQGEILPNPSPQSHIAVTSLQSLETWSGLDEFPPYQRQAGIPDELRDRNSFIGKVHAIGADGKILVVEYKDVVLPIYVPSGKLTSELYRGDIIRLSYKLQSRPDRPTHLMLDPTVAAPVEVMSSIADWHQQTMTLTGKLVKFPQSPQISLDVYAIAVETEGVTRYFTLVNFQNIDEFQGILDKLAGIWDEHIESAVNGRNLLIEPDVTIEAKGQINVVSAEQANPQILLGGQEDVRVL